MCSVASDVHLTGGSWGSCIQQDPYQTWDPYRGFLSTALGICPRYYLPSDKRYYTCFT